MKNVWQPSLKMLREGQVEELHTAATSILSRTGLNVHNEPLRKRLAGAGAQLGTAPRVYLPRDLVERALQSAKKQVVIHNRLGEPVMPLGPNQIYFGTGSDLVFTRDLETGERRPSRLEDVARAARLCDALQEIDFVMSFSLPSDTADDAVEPEQYYALVTNTVKPVIMTSFSGLDMFERFHQMACALAGGEQAFRKKPNYILYGQFVSPLEHDPLATDRLIYCADHEIPLIYIPTIMPGASGPITMAGSLALAAAETLAGLVMQQVQHPGAPFIFGACVSQLDMRMMLFPYGSAEWRISDLVMAELARHYGLPVFGTGGATDSKLVDAQAGSEYANSLLVAALAGTNLIHDVGYLDSGLTGSLESIILAADQIRWVKQFLKGIEVSEETLALGVIDEVGPARQFLDHDHTIRHMRETIYEPYALDHGDFDTWASAGGKDYAARARECAQQILESHQPVRLSDALDARLSELASAKAA
jgi:trimethylamine:corrinoid methyltransferase-like protein